MVVFRRHETTKQNIWSVDASEGERLDSDSTSRAWKNKLINGAITYNSYKSPQQWVTEVMIITSTSGVSGAHLVGGGLLFYPPDVLAKIRRPI